MNNTFLSFIDRAIGEHEIPFNIGLIICMLVLVALLAWHYRRLGNEDERAKLINYKVYRNMFYVTIFYMIFLPNQANHMSSLIAIGLVIIISVGVASVAYFMRKDVSLE